MMRRKLITMLLLLAATVAWGQTEKRLVVWQKSGEKVYFDLADLPETTFEDGKLVIKTNQATVSYQLENILRYTYQGFVATGIEQQANDRTVTVSREADEVTFGNLPEGSTVGLYAANGMLLEQFKTNAGKTFTLSIRLRPSGVYIVKAGKETIKLTRP